MVYHNKCCVPYCESISKVRHMFPNPDKDIKRFKKWILVINNLELMEMDPRAVYGSRRLSDYHFEAKDISAWSRKLFGNAVPTLNLPGSTGSNDVYDTPSTSKTSNSSAQGSTPFNELVIEIPELNESHSIEGNAGSALLSPYQLPKKKKMYGAMQRLRKNYTTERNKKKSFQRRLSDAEQFKTAHYLEENVAKLYK